MPAPRCVAESIDHSHPAWSGSPWGPNSIRAPQLAYQKAFFPLVTQGKGNVLLPEGPFVLRLALFTEAVAVDEQVLTLWGRVAEATERPLATLICRQGQLIWRCPVDARGDALFDAPADVELTTSLPVGLWIIKDTLVQPQVYRQTFGWNQTINRPEDPARRATGRPLHMARQLSSAPWNLTRLEVHTLQRLWIGQIQLLPEDTPPDPPQFNIVHRP